MSSEYDDLMMLAERRDLEAAVARLRAERVALLGRVERLDAVIAAVQGFATGLRDSTSTQHAMLGQALEALLRTVSP